MSVMYQSLSAGPFNARSRNFLPVLVESPRCCSNIRALISCSVSFRGSCCGWLGDAAAVLQARVWQGLHVHKELLLVDGNAAAWALLAHACRPRSSAAGVWRSAGSSDIALLGPGTEAASK